MTLHARFLALADRLRRLTAGSAEADNYIHRALGRAGPVLPYTRYEAAALVLLPPGFEGRAGAPRPRPGAMIPGDDASGGMGQTSPST